MKNLEQIRAKNALAAVKDPVLQGAEGGDIVRKVPGMIRTNGLLAALAFAISKDPKDIAKRGENGYRRLFDSVATHLKSLGQVQASALGVMQANDADGLTGEVAGMPAAKLRAISDETLAYLGYVRRFYKGNGKDKG